MRVCNLASGSKGNSTFVEAGGYKFLLDAGKNIKYITEALEDIGISIKDIDYVLVSHTHSDHIACLKQVLKKSHAKLCIPEKMLFELEDLKEYEDVMALEDEMIVNDVFIKSFKSSHDATDSRNFIIKDETGSMAYITDTGYLNQKYFKMLSNLNLYLFECNHDIEMLEDGPYPKWLKTRVLSDVGHLSNNMAGFYLAKLIGPDTKDVLLIHLSETNNKPEIALKTVKETLDDYEVDFKNIKCACQDKKSEVYVL